MQRARAKPANTNPRLAFYKSLIITVAMSECATIKLMKATLSNSHPVPLLFLTSDRLLPTARQCGRAGSGGTLRATDTTGRLLLPANYGGTIPQRIFAKALFGQLPICP
jgi:hypothetical protein